MLAIFFVSSSQFRGQREDLQIGIEADFLAVASLSCWIGVGRSSELKALV